MSGFETDRANRRAAWAMFEGRLAQVKADLAGRSIKERIAAKAKDDALAVADEAIAVAKDNKGLVAAAIAAVLAWVLRAPLLSLVSTRLHGQAPVKPAPANDDFSDTLEEPAQ